MTVNFANGVDSGEWRRIVQDQMDDATFSDATDTFADLIFETLANRDNDPGSISRTDVNGLTAGMLDVFLNRMAGIVFDDIASKDIVKLFDQFVESRDDVGTSLTGEDFKDFINDKILADYGFELTAGQAALLENVLDTNSYSGVDRSELAAGFKAPEDVRHPNRSERINRDEFVDYVTINSDDEGGEKVNEEGARFLFNAFNTDGGGAITELEWKELGFARDQGEAFLAHVANAYTQGGADWDGFGAADRTGNNYDGALNRAEFLYYMLDLMEVKENRKLKADINDLFDDLNNDEDSRAAVLELHELLDSKEAIDEFVEDNTPTR